MQQRERLETLPFSLHPRASAAEKKKAEIRDPSTIAQDDSDGRERRVLRALLSFVVRYGLVVVVVLVALLPPALSVVVLVLELLSVLAGGLTTVVEFFSTVFSAGALLPPVAGVSTRCSQAVKRDAVARTKKRRFIRV